MSCGTMLPTTEITPRAADRQQRQREAVVAAEHGQVRWRQDLRGLVHRAGGFLDHGDVRQLGHAGDRFRLDVLAGAAGDVVDADRDVDRFGQGLEVLIEAFLRRLVVVGSHDQGGVGAASAANRVSRRASAVLFEPVPAMTLIRPAGDLDHRGDHPLVLLVRERGRFARGADRAEAGGAGRDLKLDLAAQRVVVDLPRRETA